MPVDLHQVIKTDTFDIVELPFPVLNQQRTELFLLVSIHIPVTQGKNLLIRQHFDRRFIDCTIEPLHQNLLKAAIGVHCDLPYTPGEVSRDIERYRFIHNSDRIFTVETKKVI